MTNHERAQQLAENAYLKLIARAGMLLASGFFLPLFLWFASQAYKEFKDMQTAQATIVTTLKLTNQAAESRKTEVDYRLNRLEQNVDKLRDRSSN